MLFNVFNIILLLKLIIQYYFKYELYYINIKVNINLIIFIIPLFKSN